MATAKQIADFSRRSAGSQAPVVPIKELPKASETLSALARSPAGRAALKNQDEQNEEWRKSLSFSVSGGRSEVSARTSTTTVVAAPAVPAPSPGPVPVADISVICPDNGKRYKFIPRVGSGTGSGVVIVGQWVEA